MAGWGGKRAGSGPEKKHPLSERLDVVHDYAEARDIARELKRKIKRATLIRKLAKQHGMTRRYVARCLDELYPRLRAEAARLRARLDQS